jgi:hypothetical protein
VLKGRLAGPCPRALPSWTLRCHPSGMRRAVQQGARHVANADASVARCVCLVTLQCYADSADKELEGLWQPPAHSPALPSLGVGDPPLRCHHVEPTRQQTVGSFGPLSNAVAPASTSPSRRAPRRGRGGA